MTRTDSNAVELADYRAILWRHKFLVVACAVLGLLGSYFYTRAQPQEFESTASVLVNPIVLDPFGSNAQRKDSLVDLDTEAQLVRAAPVADLARASLQPEQSAAALAQHVSVSVPADTTVLNITFTDDNARDAQLGAQGFATAYLTHRAAQAEAGAKKRVEALTAQANTVSEQLQDVSTRLPTLPTDSPDRAYVLSQQSSLTSQLTNLRNMVAALSVLDIDPGEVIKAAQLPVNPSRPLVPVNLAIGLLGGLLLGVVLAVIRERSDKRLRDAGMVQREFGLPVLAQLAKGALRGPNGAPLVSPASPDFEPYRLLRNNLAQASAPGEGLVTLVTSASAALRATPVAANLAVALARSGASVVLVRADFAAPADEVLDGEERGLSDILVGECSVADVVRDLPDQPELQLIGIGLQAERAAELLPGRRMSELLATLRRSVDHVIVEAPPAPQGAGAQALAALADGALLVLTARRSKRRDLELTQYQLDQVQIPVLGAVLTSPGLGSHRVRPTPSALSRRVPARTDEARAARPADA